MRIRSVTAATVAVILCAAGATAQTPDERVAARDLLTKRGAAVVTARATVTMRGLPGRADGVEDTVQATAVVIDGTGLAVTALSQLDPSEMVKRAVTGMPGAPAMNLSVEQANLRLRLADGREVPAKIVLRDHDLDLAFLRPSEPPASPMASVDLSTVARAQVADLVLVVQRFGEMTGWKVGISFGDVQAIIEKPRTQYIVAAPTIGGGLGSAVFDAAGHFLGIVVVRSQTSSGRRSVFAMMQGVEGAGVLPIVLPADEIIELAKQAK
jgi:S1-C subfamily serine protease